MPADLFELLLLADDLFAGVRKDSGGHRRIASLQIVNFGNEELQALAWIARHYPLFFFHLEGPAA